MSNIPNSRKAKDIMQPIPERPSIAAIWERLLGIDRRLQVLEDSVTNHITSRLTKIENSLSYIAGAAGIMRWVVPIGISILIVFLSRLL